MAGAGEAIYQGFLARGFSPPQAAVLAGNAQQESSLNPLAVNPASGAFGLMQWLGPRATALQNYAQATGRSADDLNTQMDFVAQEMRGPEAANAKSFLASTDVGSANAALKGYLRYGPNESGNRLQYSTAFAQNNGGQPMAQGTPSAGDTNSQLDAIFNSAAPSTATAPDAATSSALDAIFGPSATPSAQPIVTGPGTFAGKPITPGALGNNPMAVRKGAPASPASNSYTPSAIPFLDPIAAGANALVNNLPYGIGPVLTRVGNTVDAGLNNFLGFPEETPEDRAAVNSGLAQQFPGENAAGAVVGAVAPYVMAGPESLAAKALGTASDYGLGTVGNMAARVGASGLSAAANIALDAAARGDTDNLGTNMLTAAGVGAVSPAVARALGGTGALKAIATGTALGAGVGGIGTLVTGGTPQQAAQNAMTGAVIGGGVPAGARVLGTLAGKLVAGGVPRSVADLADLAVNKYGIQLSPAQISTNPFMKMADSVVNRLPLTGGTGSAAAQASAFNRAVANTFGSSADALTSEVMSAARTRLGSVFDSVAQRTPNIAADQAFDQSMLDTLTNAQQVLTDSEIKPLSNQFDAILGKFQQGGNSINGDVYQALTRKDAPLDRLEQDPNPNVRFYAGQMRDALDDALQRSAPPDALADLQQARAQYKALKTIEPLAAKAPTGEISPALLSGAVRQSYGDVAYGGGGNLAELARIGQQFLKAPPNSGTPERMLVNKLLGIEGAAGGAGIAGLAMNPAAIPGALAGGATYAAAAPALGAAMRSKALANTLIAKGLGTTAPFSAATNMLTRAAVPLLPPSSQNALTQLRLAQAGS